MKQVILTNSCGYPHPLLQTVNKKELLQAKLDRGATIETLMVDLECVFPADSKHYVRYETVQDFVDAMNNNDSTQYFTLLNLPEPKHGMTQIALEIPTDSPHLEKYDYHGFQEDLQQQIDSGKNWGELLSVLQEKGDLYTYSDLTELSNFLNGEDVVANYFVVLNIPAEEIKQQATPALRAEKAEIIEKPVFDYNLVAFQNHMHSKLEDAVDDMEKYVQVMTVLWNIFNNYGWNSSDRGYLESIDYFQDNYRPNVKLKDRLKIGSKVETIRGQVLTVENFMFVNPDDCYSSEYCVFIKFTELDQAQSFTDYGWNSTASMYSPLNIVAIDGVAN